MGTCQIQSCKCQCTQQKVNCTCQLSQPSGNLNIDEENQNDQRSNRFIQENNKKKSPGNSKESTDTVKLTKSTKTNGLISSRSIDKFQQCNIRTETESNWVPVRQKVSRRIIPVQEMGIYFRESFASPKEPKIGKSAQLIDIMKSDDILEGPGLFKLDYSPDFVSDYSPDVNLDYSPDVQTDLYQKKEEKETSQYSSNFAQASSLNQKKYLNTLQSMDKSLKQGSGPYTNSFDQLFQVQNLSPDQHQQQPKAASVVISMINSSQGTNKDSDTLRPQVQSVSRQGHNDNNSSIGDTTPKSALKERGRSKDNQTYRSHKVGQLKSVKFNLPQSYYQNEKIKAQQKFY